jgi:beta-lactamase regulating signal transducer with metallopeptidase domain
MSLLLDSVIKISLLIAVALIAAALMRRRSAALRHWVLAAAMLVALATPLLIAFAPSWRLPIDPPVAEPRPARTAALPRNSPPRDRVQTRVADVSADVDPASTMDIVQVAVAIWLTGLAINLSGLLFGLWRLRRIASRAVPVDEGPWAQQSLTLATQYRLPRPVTLLRSDQPATLMTWGFVEPQVLLPRDADTWPADRIHVVLAHELAHIQRGDWIVQIAGELLRIVYWFNPLVWLACARLRLESERACDDAVVTLGVHGRDYATHLLELARQFGRARQHSLPAVAIAPRPSSLHRRVSAMLNTRLSRRPVSTTVRLGTIAALLAVALPIALFAQNTFATLTGTISDQSGAVLPGVIVAAVDRDRRVRHEVKTDDVGRFEIIGLPQGNYSLQAVLPGFETLDEGLSLGGQDVDRRLTLSIGSLQETVSVSSGQNVSSSPRERAKARPANCGATVARGSVAAPRTGGPVRVGGQIRQPTKLYHVSPVYPEGSPAGIVTMKTLIGPDGYVQEIEVTNGAPAALAQAATDAVRQWEFEPTLLNCTAVPVKMTVTVDFN